ncbi:MAG: hypothetical protein V7637_4776 [Mycobacteriales bacterium]
MTDELHGALADLVGSVPVSIDVDRQIARGRRRRRLRRLTAAGATVAAVCAAAIAVATVTAPAGGTRQPAATQPPRPAPATPTTPAPPSQTVRPPAAAGHVPDTVHRTSARSRALLAQLRQLAPELRPIAGGVYSDDERWTDGVPHGLSADVMWQYPPDRIQGASDVQIQLMVTAGTFHGPEVCQSVTAPLEERCTDVRRLPDGSTAYLRDVNLYGGVPVPDRSSGDLVREVRLVRADGVEVWLKATAEGPVQHPVPLDLARVLQIADNVTVFP